jgi:hypothetical protein
MIAFAFLGNTLFLTILVAMLSNTFSAIVSNVAVENQYRRAIFTFGGVNSDAIFTYQPPFNILALCILLPLKLFLSPRWFHKVNVAAIRTLNAPLLVMICLYERRYLWTDMRRKVLRSSKTRGRLAFWTFQKLSIPNVVQAVFNVSSQSIQSIPEEGQGEKHSDIDAVDEGHCRIYGTCQAGSSSRADRRTRNRRFSTASSAAFEEDLHNTFTPDNIDECNCNKHRIEALEASNTRIEYMFQRLCEALGQTGSDGEIDLNTSVATGRNVAEKRVKDKGKGTDVCQ